MFTNLETTLSTFSLFFFFPLLSGHPQTLKTKNKLFAATFAWPSVCCPPPCNALEDVFWSAAAFPSLLCLEPVHGVVLGETVALLVYAQHRLALPALVRGAPLKLHHAAHDAAALGAWLRVVVRTPGPPLAATRRVPSGV